MCVLNEPGQLNRCRLLFFWLFGYVVARLCFRRFQSCGHRANLFMLDNRHRISHRTYRLLFRRFVLSLRLLVRFCLFMLEPLLLQHRLNLIIVALDERLESVGNLLVWLRNYLGGPILPFPNFICAERICLDHFQFCGADKVGYLVYVI